MLRSCGKGRVRALAYGVVCTYVLIVMCSWAITSIVVAKAMLEMVAAPFVRDDSRTHYAQSVYWPADQGAKVRKEEEAPSLLQR